MLSDVPAAGAASAKDDALPTVTIEPTAAGWRIVRESGREGAFATVEDAQRVALGRAPACELIIHDAYHRVVRRELVDVARPRPQRSHD